MAERRRFFAAIARAALGGAFRLPGGHLPPAGHAVSPDFAGVGVAAAADPAVDDYIIEQLAAAGISAVRIDFSSADEGGAGQRLLTRLLAGGYRVILHLQQLPAEARRMPQAEEGERWRAFVCRTLDAYGGAVELIELGSTVNRQRWCGHSLDGFLAMWAIGHAEVKKRHLTLLGPNVTDFEPPWNVGLLALLARRRQLPDVQSTNLFSERCSEPEVFDHKILGYRLAFLHKFNLVKKARLLAQIGRQHGVGRLISPAAFWTLPRIARRLPASEEKQADYLARYLLLAAASGALERACWGPLICHREGLIDNGARPYPALERITRYADLEGSRAEMRPRPALRALVAFVARIPGSVYLGRQGGAGGLEMHAFRRADTLWHAVWTTNGAAARLDALYSAADLAAARFFDRDGEEAPAEDAVRYLVSETPRYLAWPAARPVTPRPGAASWRGLLLDAHPMPATMATPAAPAGAGRRAYAFADGAWQGVILASSAAEFALLASALHPEKLAPQTSAILRRARNAIWKIPDPRRSGAFLVAKKPERMPFYRRLLDRNKPVKGLRSWSGASALGRIGVASAPPVAFFERCGDASRKDNFYICEQVPTDHSIREVFAALNAGATAFAGVSAAVIYPALARYVLRMHGGGVFFRDMSSGNILFLAGADGTAGFSLIDTGRIRLYPAGVPLRARLADLARICNKLAPAGRQRLLDEYFTAMQRRFAWYMHLPFWLYDQKVSLKRRIGRKAIKRLLRRLRPAPPAG